MFICCLYGGSFYLCVSFCLCCLYVRLVSKGKAVSLLDTLSEEYRCAFHFWFSFWFAFRLSVWCSFWFAFLVFPAGFPFGLSFGLPVNPIQNKVPAQRKTSHGHPSCLASNRLGSAGEKPGVGPSPAQRFWGVWQEEQLRPGFSAFVCSRIAVISS